jgi:hypothetical protein
MAAVLSAISLAQAQPIPAPREGQTPKFPGSAERGPAVERRAPPGTQAEEQQARRPAKPAVGPESQNDADPCTGDPACYQRRDLQAQQDMAIAAYWMTMATWVQVGIAVIGTIVAIAGTILLLRSLKYARDATTAAANAATAAAEANRLSTATLIVDQRPWVFVEKCEPATNLHWGVFAVLYQAGRLHEKCWQEPSSQR